MIRIAGVLLFLTALLRSGMAFPAEEPPFTIRMMSGSSIAADKTWVDGERLFYERRGFPGNVRLVDVSWVTDPATEAARGKCGAFENQINEDLKIVREVQENYKSRSLNEQAALGRSVVEWTARKGREADIGCADFVKRFFERVAIFDQAREAAKQKAPQ
jgi:hypothetical protein